MTNNVVNFHHEYGIGDIGVTPDEVSMLQLVAVNEFGEFNDYSDGSGEFEKRLSDFLQGIGDNPFELTEVMVSIIKRLLQQAKKDARVDYAWTTVRVQSPSKAFVIPRWHTDGNFFPSEAPVYKTTFVLKGAPTRLARIVKPDKFSRLDLLDDTEHNRRLKQELVKEIYPSIRSQALRFCVGDKCQYAHSEPNLTLPRIFASVLPGTKEQISSLRI